MNRKMAIIGGGPVGLECLRRGLSEGWSAVLFERGRIGENIRSWGHVRMFSPLAMNMSDAGGAAAAFAWEGGALVTGAEYVEKVLEPLARRADLAPSIHAGAAVLAVGRGPLRKGEAIGNPDRSRAPFRLLVEEGGRERAFEADIVVDASGTYADPNWMGEGGIPAIKERELRPWLRYRLPEITGGERWSFAGRHTLVVGHGHSAATAIGWLSALAKEVPGTRVTWITRTLAARPVAEVPGDPLPERARVSREANDAAALGMGWLEHLAGTHVRELRRADGGFEIMVSRSQGSARAVRVQRVLALVGYRPDLSLLRELQVRTCWATEGTYALAAALLTRNGADATDCLTTGAELDARTLLHPEPGFFVIGAKSYGRNPHFLIRTGLKQVEDLFTLLQAR